MTYLNSESFDFNNQKWLAERYTNITKKDFPIFYKQLEKFETDITSNKIRYLVFNTQ